MSRTIGTIILMAAETDYYRCLADKFRERWPGQLADELHEIVEVLQANSPTRDSALKRGAAE